jgi:hypothetical protein
MAFLFLILPVFLGVAFPFSILTEPLPARIDIDNGFIYMYDKTGKNIGTSEVKNSANIADYGTFYYMEDHSIRLFQKDLIVQGTLEDFEKVFESKIVRKTLDK